MTQTQGSVGSSFCGADLADSELLGLSAPGAKTDALRQCSEPHSDICFSSSTSKSQTEKENTTKIDKYSPHP